jgi:hypothetical protein
MKVRAIEDHANDYGVREGGPYEKAKKTEYNIDDDQAAQALIDAGLVEEVKGAGSNRSHRGSEGAGSGSE